MSYPGEIGRVVEQLDQRFVLSEATNLKAQLDAIPADLRDDLPGAGTANTPLVPPGGDEGGEKTMEERMAEAREIDANHVV